MGNQLLIPLYCNQWGKARWSSEPTLICCLPGWTLNPAGISQSGMHCGKYDCESSNVCWWYMCVQPIGVATGSREPCPPKLKNMIILYFERRFSKQNSVIRLKSNILAPQKNFWPPSNLWAGYDPGSAPVLVGCNVFWIFVVTMLLNMKSFLIATKQLVFFFAQKRKKTCPIKCFSKWCMCTISWPSEICWCVNKCIIEGWWWYSESSEITILCSKKTQRHFWSVHSCSKKHFISCLLHANVCLPIVEQIHADQHEALTCCI